MAREDLLQQQFKYSETEANMTPIHAIGHPKKGEGALLGLAVGDALGVPFEFLSRETMSKKPALDMVGHGTHNQLPGTWSDDSSLTFCLAESLLTGYDLVDMAQKFVDWKYHCYWTAHQEVFDIGNTTAIAIARLNNLLAAKDFDLLKRQKELGEESENGNGSLMRILPLLFLVNKKSIQYQFDLVWEVSALTHRHIRAAMACLIYLKFAEYLLDGHNKQKAYLMTRTDISAFWDNMNFPPAEQEHFARLIRHDIQTLDIDDLKSAGYVINTLESSFWCLLLTDNYREAVLSAVNLGEDTDTTAAVTGGLAGLYYGAELIPENWLSLLQRRVDIQKLGMHLGMLSSEKNTIL